MSELIVGEGSGRSDAEGEAKIEFPCEYPIKVLGDNVEGFREQVEETLRLFDPGLDSKRTTEKTSKKSRFLSVTVFITATGKDQLSALHVALKKLSAVKMVL